MRRLFVALGAILLAAPNLKTSAAQNASAQAPEPSWEVAAGGKMSFDVASVKRDTSGTPFPPNFPVSGDDSYFGNTTLFRSGLPLTADIAFAYKLLPSEEQQLRSQLSKWAQTEIFDIEARAALPSTKDQMRLMMQSLLENRFKLKVHFETKQKPVFALVLVRPGQTGPQLRRYGDDPPCAGTLAGRPKIVAGQLPPLCYALFLVPGTINGVSVFTWGSRNVSMRQIAGDMGAAPNTNLDRPVVDETGLSGNFDFLMTFSAKPPLTADAAPKDSAPTFLEALKDQLGLKLESTTAPVTTLVIDHIEEPTPN